MIYCFVEEDIHDIDCRDPLLLQYNYARLMDKCLVINLAKKSISKWDGTPYSVNGERVLLRTTCDYVSEAQAFLSKIKCNLLEDISNIEQIVNWNSMNLTGRKIHTVKVSDIIQGNVNSEILNDISYYNECFVKTNNKGFTLIISSNKIISCDDKWMNFLNEHVKSTDEELLITQRLHIKTDSLGKRETRHFVIDGKIISSSRNVHSLKHNVMPSHLEKAQTIVNQIAQTDYFPQSYVLDLGEFIDGTDTNIDIVEFNPITLAMCYVNNTIFTECQECITDARKTYNIGYEFCLDAVNNPNAYHLKRELYTRYEYINEEHYIMED